MRPSTLSAVLAPSHFREFLREQAQSPPACHLTFIKVRPKFRITPMIVTSRWEDRLRRYVDPSRIA
jgi:hypothetical protein